MNALMKHTVATTALALSVLTLAGCASNAEMASRNISTAADQFEIDRRVVFFNGITDTYLLSIEGRCSIEDQETQLEVTCQVGEDKFKKHFLGLSDNVSYFVEQLDPVEASAFHYRVIFKPEAILPDIDLVTSAQ